MVELDNEDDDLDFITSPDGKNIAFSDGKLYVVDIAAKRKDKGIVLSPLFVYLLFCLGLKPHLISEDIIAFFWSPNSRYLLYITSMIRYCAILVSLFDI